MTTPYPEATAPFNSAFGTTYHNASSVRRTLAVILDTVLVVIVASIIFFSVGAERLEFLSTNDTDTEFSVSSDDNDANDEDLATLNINGAPVSQETLGIILGMIGIVRLLYSVIELLDGTSPAKRFLGIEVIWENGNRGTRRLFAMRWAIKYGGSIIGIIGIIGGIGILSDIGLVWTVIIVCGYALVLRKNSNRQALHDFIARSRVVQK